MNFKFKKLDSKLWNYISQEDAKILLGYCYGRYHFLSYHDAKINIDTQYKILVYKDLISSLILNNNVPSYRLEIKKLIEAIIGILLKNLENTSLEDDLAVIDITELSLLVIKMKLHELKDSISKLINLYISHLSRKNKDEEDIMELKFHYNLYTEHQKYEIDILKIEDPLLEVLVKKDGDSVTEMVEDILQGILEKVTNAKHKESPLFLDRTVLFREIGSGFIWSGYIEIAKIVGCQIKPNLPKVCTLFSFENHEI